MKYTLLDTCVWINLFSRPKLSEVSQKILELLDSDIISIVMPDIVREEIDRHKNTFEKKYIEATISPLKNAVNALKEYTGIKEEACKVSLSELIELMGANKGYVLLAKDKIDKILNHKNTISISMKEKDYKDVVRLGIDKKAPFKTKNSVADAVLLCAAREFVSQNGSELVFVTENTSDFSDPKDNRLIHQDIHEFLGVEVVYSINIADVINEIQPDAVPEEIVAVVADAVTQRGCEKHEFEDGCWRPSLYGGLTWHLICCKCGSYFDTGETYD